MLKIKDVFGKLIAILKDEDTAPEMVEKKIEKTKTDKEKNTEKEEK